MNIEARDLLLYAVTDDAWLGGRSLSDCVEQALNGGATCVQLRAKHASTEQMCDQANTLIPLCEQRGVPFIINDDIKAACRLGVGLHIGQDDIDARRARAELGPHAILGVSAQTVEQACAAQAAGANYLGVGALVPTATKSDAVDVTYDELRAICSAVDIPVVGIGGLNARTIPRFAGSGAAGAAVVSAIFAAENIEDDTRTLLKICAETFAAPRPASFIKCPE